jgi:hypothetical protein
LALALLYVADGLASDGVGDGERDEGEGERVFEREREQARARVGWFFRFGGMAEVNSKLKMGYSIPSQ